MADEVLGQMVIELGLKDSAFNRGIAGTKKAVRNSMSEMKSMMAVVGQAGSKFDVLAAKQRGLTKVLEAQKAEMAALRKQYEGSITATGQATKKTADYARQFNNASTKVASLNSQLVANAKAMAAAKVETTGFSGKLNSFGKVATKVGDRMKSIGDYATTKLSVPLAVGFGYAMNSAVKFNSQISKLGPLLTNGATVTGKYKAQLNQLGDASKKWSMQFGVSTGSINTGMGELIRKGYSAKQTLGAMPSILNATRASGDDFNDVMHVSTSVLEQFGLKVNSTKGMVKNTSRVTDTLTDVANRTAAGFKDMGEAMTYVGPTAHAAGISLEQTAAAIGLMSNRGIEGTVAGTALRSALTRLMKPSKQNAEGFKEMGINVADFKKGTLTLPEIIDKINNNTKSWTKEQKASAIAMAFGTEAQAGMNALISAGGDQLRDYTSKAKNASGETKKIADSMNNTQQAKIQRFQQSLHVLSIDIGEKLLPTFEPLLTKADHWIQAFSKMDSSTQQMIIKAGLMAAAFGPVTSILGRVVTIGGKFATGAVGIASWFAKLRAGKTAVTDLGLVSKGMGNSTKLAAGGIEAMAGSSTAAASSISLLNPVVLGIGATVIAGTAVWELWGKKAYESSQRTGRWGADVGQQADSALTKFKGFSSQAGSSLTDFEKASQTSTKDVSKDFSDMYSEMKQDSTDTINQMKRDMKGLPASVQADLKEDIKERQKHNAKVLADAKTNYVNAETILKSHNGKVSSLSDTERTMLLNYQRQMNEDEVSLLKIGGSAKKNVLAALNGDIGNMTRKQRNTTINELTSSMQKENKLYDDQKNQIDSMYDNGEISSKQYAQALKDLQTTHESTTDGMAAAILKLDKANGASKAQITQDLLNVGYTYKQAAAIVKQQNANMANSTSLAVKETGNMTTKSKAAAEMWNGLVFDPKTGKVKTNAQEEVNKAVQNSKQWNQIKLLAKQGKMSSNAKAMVADALISSGKWDSLSFKQQKMWIQSNAGTQIYQALSVSGQWNSLSFEAKTAIVNAKGLPQLAQAVVKYNLWNALPTKVKQLLASDTSASKTLNQAGINVQKYNQTNPKHKVLTGNASGVNNAASSGQRSIGNFNSTAPLGKRFTGNSSNVDGASNRGTRSIGDFNSVVPLGKRFTGNSSSVDGASSRGRSSVHNFNSTSAQRKNFNGNASSAINASSIARKAISAWNSIHPETKIFTAIYKTIKKAVKGHATGTNNHPGGPMLVNDQAGARFRELIKFPNGYSFVPYGRNVMLDAPRGTKVFTASMTERMLGKMPQYANGVGIPENAGILAAATNVTNQFNDSSNRNVVSSTEVDMSGLENRLDQVTKLLLLIAQKDSNVIMDGRAVGKLVTQHVSNKQMQNVGLTERGVYGG
ncbi:MAG: phage tail tape measure protein [Liquorilactobacillus ghanensis]|uniref:phage tail tape measure protein n=1 Tax=Liquorilactobacillus ghanensis TaxID=399370 RepID=UPI0039EC97AF